jgi:hypothetical protein
MRGNEGVFIDWEEWRPINVPCQQSVCLFTTALGSNHHRIGWWRWSGVVLPWMPSYLHQTAILHAKSSVKHMQPTFGEVVWGSMQSLGLNRANGGRTFLGSGRSTTGAKLAHFWWVTSFGLLEWAYIVLLLRRSDLIWVCPCSPLFQDLILLVSGPSPLGFMSVVYNVVFLVYFRLIFYVILTCPPVNK